MSALLILEREAGEEFRLAADFQTEIVGLAGVEDLFHALAGLRRDPEHAPGVLAEELARYEAACRR